MELSWKYAAGIIKIGASLVLLFILLYIFRNNPPCLSLIDDNYHHYGDVIEGKTIRYVYSIKNTGKKDLIIKHIAKNCSCTDVDVDKKVLKKGDIARITFSYIGRPVRETTERLTATIVSNDPQKPLFQLGLSLNVIKSIYWYPDAVSFYSDYGLKGRHQIINFLSDYIENMEITGIDTSSDKIMAIILREDKLLQCNVTLNEECPKGNWTEHIIIHCQINETSKDIMIPVNLMIY